METSTPTVEAKKAWDIMNLVSFKSYKVFPQVREIFKRYQVSLSLASLTTTVPLAREYNNKTNHKKQNTHTQ